MSIVHAFSNTNSNFTGTFTGFDSQANTLTLAATNIVRPVDWNSGHNIVQNLSGNTLGTSQVSGTDIVLAGGNNVTLSAAGNTVSIGVGNYITTARASTDAIGLNTAQSNVTWTANSSGLSLDARGYAGTNTGATNASVTVNSSGVSVAVGNYITTARASNDAIGLNTAQSNVTWTANSSGLSLDARGYAGTGTSATNASVTLNSNGLAISVAPPGGGGVVPLSAFEPFPIVTSTAFSSHALASWFFQRIVLPAPISFSNVNFINTFQVTGGSATSVASSNQEGFSYSKGVTIFSRQDYGAHSTNLSYVTTGSVGISVTQFYTSTSIAMSFAWVTDSTGGTSSVSASSSNGNVYSFFNGNRFVEIPMVTSLPAGEYWVAVKHSSSTSNAGNSHVVPLAISQLHQAYPVVQVAGNFGNSLATSQVAFSGPAGIGDYGIASAVTTNATMPGSVISGATCNLIYFNFSNA